MLSGVSPYSKSIDAERSDQVVGMKRVRAEWNSAASSGDISISRICSKLD